MRRIRGRADEATVIDPSRIIPCASIPVQRRRLVERVPEFHARQTERLADHVVNDVAEGLSRRLLNQVADEEVSDVGIGPPFPWRKMHPLSQGRLKKFLA